MPLDPPRPAMASSDSAAETLNELWAQAIHRHRSQTGSNETEFENVVETSKTADAMLKAVEQSVGDFEKFREHGSKIRSILRPIAAVLLSVSDAGSNVASAALPGGTFIVVAIAGLLKATQKVSELYDTIETVLVQIRDALDRFGTYLAPSIPISSRLAESFVGGLVIVLDLIASVTKHCSNATSPVKRFLLRSMDYMHQIMDNTEVQELVVKLHDLTNVQSLQTAAETHANVRELRAIMTYLQTSKDFSSVQSTFPLGNADTLYDRLLEPRERNTCDWFMKEESFQQWRKKEKGVLALLGPAACGKTTVCSFVIESLQAELNEQHLKRLPTFTLAYFYFRVSTNTDEQNDGPALMNSLILQLARASLDCWKYLWKAFPGLGKQHLSRKQRFTILHAMLDIVGRVGPTIIVVDALDECYSKDSRSSGTQRRMLEFLRELHNLEIPTLRLLVTSRPEQSIVQWLKDLDPMEVKLTETHGHKVDIATYVERYLPKTEVWDIGMREKATEALNDREKSQGMFLWVILQIDHLGRLTRQDDIQTALDKLPRGLEETYRGILQRFDATSPDVYAILGFIAFAVRPPTVAEVVAAHSFDFAAMKTKPPGGKITDSEGFIHRMLPGLIDIVDPGKQQTKEKTDRERTVQFIHFSVKEYLTSDVLRRDVAVCGYYLDRYICDTALAMLILEALNPDNKPVLGSLEKYALKNWHRHVPPDVGDSKIDSPGQLVSSERRDAAKRLNMLLEAFLRIKEPAFRAWRKDEYERRSWTPFHAVAHLGPVGQVTRLADQGADYDAFANGETPLHCAVKQKANPCTQRLMDAGANPNLTQGSGFTPLHYAASIGDIATAHTLIKGGANTAARTTLEHRIHESSYGGMSQCIPIGATPLHVAVMRGRTDVCELLWTADFGLREIPDWFGETPLHYAARANQPDVLRHLLQSGANAHAVDCAGHTPLHVAQSMERRKCAELLEPYLKEVRSPYTQTESVPQCAMTSNTTLHAYLRPKASTSVNIIEDLPSVIEYSLNMGWSYDVRTIHNHCLLTLSLCTASRSPFGHDSIWGVGRHFATFSGVNAEGDFRRIKEQSSVSLDQRGCIRECGEMATRGAQNDTENATKGPAQYLLVHWVPAGELPAHPPVKFPLPAPGSSWNYFPDDHEKYLYHHLVTAAVHFQSCGRDATNCHISRRSSTGLAVFKRLFFLIFPAFKERSTIWKPVVVPRASSTLVLVLSGVVALLAVLYALLASSHVGVS